MKKILERKSIKIALTILGTLMLVLIGLHIVDGAINQSYQQLLEKTAQTAKDKNGEVVYLAKNNEHQTVIAYVPKDISDDDSKKIADIIDVKMTNILASSNKKDTVYVLNVNKSTELSNIVTYQFVQEEYHYQNKQYELMTTQAFQTALKSDEWLSFFDLLSLNSAKIEDVMTLLKSTVMNSHFSTEDRKEILGQLSTEKLKTLPYIYTDTIIGLVFNVQGINKVVPLSSGMQQLMTYIKYDLLYDSYKTEQMQQIREARIRNDKATLLENIANRSVGYKIALTFDDGPNRNTTTKLLDILKEEDVKATFFVLGKNISGNEDILVRQINEGHQIGSHSWSHRYLPTLPLEDIKKELDDTQEAIQKVTNVTTHLFRPPYGAINDVVLNVKDVAVIQWSIDSNDWNVRNASLISKNVVASVKGGAIILMHDIYNESVEAARDIVKQLKAQGYKFVTIDELYGSDRIVPFVQYYHGNLAK